MTVTLLPSGNLRVQVFDGELGKYRNVSDVLGLPRGSTWPNTKQGKEDAKRAELDARAKLREAADTGITVAQFRERWLTDLVFTQRRKDSTIVLYRERTKRFCDLHGDLPMPAINDEIVAAWLAGGRRNGTVPALRTMFADAASADAGRLIGLNPFAGLRLEKSKGRAILPPPTAKLAARMVEVAREKCGPGFALWLKFAMGTGMRPGEIDCVRWVEDPEAPWYEGRKLSSHIDGSDADGRPLSETRLWVGAQFSAIVSRVTLPKNNTQRKALITPMAAEALEEARELGSLYCFCNIRGEHWTRSAREYQWEKVRKAVGWTGKRDLYLATRHYAGKYLYNDLRIDAEDVATFLGHTDHGALVKELYGHFDADEALDRVEARLKAAEGLRVVEGQAEERKAA